jgi:hypothetical protein
MTHWQPIETAPKELGQVILGRLGPYDPDEIAAITYCIDNWHRGFWRVVLPSSIANQLYADDAPHLWEIETRWAWAPTEWMPRP